MAISSASSSVMFANDNSAKFPHPASPAPRPITPSSQPRHALVTPSSQPHHNLVTPSSQPHHNL
eukprot:6933248-Pyramimonas_sp.AAC.1